MSKLIVYYSRKGNNYFGGSIKNIPVGNTEVAAKMLAQITGAELFELEPVREYSADYTECTMQAQDEKQANARPELKAYPDSLDGYDTIYLGFPNWWGTMPMPVFTFLEKFDFGGKTIKPFCTNEGSGMGTSENDIKSICKGAKVEKGLSIRGSDVKNAKSALEKWV